MKEKPKHNLYTAIAKAMIQGPHIDTGNNNFFTAMGWKAKKPEKPINKPVKKDK